MAVVSKSTSAELTKSSKPSRADGTKERPYKFYFNAEDPEANPFEFFVMKKQNTLVGGKTSTVLEISKDLGSDFDDWSASVVTDGDYAMRAILFQGVAVGLSMLAFLEQTSVHDENDPNRKTLIDAFLAQHKRAKEQNHVGSLFKHYMLILPKDMYVDNAAIASNGSVVDCSFTEIKFKPPAFNGVEFVTMLGTWEVAVRRMSL